VEAKTSTARDIAALEARVMTAEAHVVDEATTGEKLLVNFETGLVENLAGLRTAYECNVQSIGGLYYNTPCYGSPNPSLITIISDLVMHYMP
jgi:hypothetical protein